MVTVQQNGRKVYDVTDGLKSDRTKEEYGRAFNAFLKNKFEGQTSFQLLQVKPKQMEEIIADYLLSLKQRGLKHSSINNAKSAILHFFVINRVQLNNRWISKFIEPDEDHKEDRAYTDTEVEKLLAASDERFKVVILLMASTGMRKGAIPDLRILDLTKLFLSGIETYKIQVYARSAKDRYYCFATPELTKAVDAYLDYRERFGEITSPDAPLIREQFDTYDPRAAHKPRFMSINTFDKAIRRLIVKAGLQTIGEVSRTNGFRKRVISIMIKARVAYETREYLVGHKHSRGLDFNYDRTTEEERFIEWSKAINLLTVDPTQRLQRENEDLRSSQAQQIAILKTQLYEYKEFASKTAAEVRDLKARQDAYGRESIYYVNPAFSNLTDNVNKLEAKYGKQQIPTTPIMNKVLLAEKIRNEIRRLQGIEEQPHPDNKLVKAERLRDLEDMLKEIEGT
jgi:integrase